MALIEKLKSTVENSRNDDSSILDDEEIKFEEPPKKQVKVEDDMKSEKVIPESFKTAQEQYQMVNPFNAFFNFPNMPPSFCNPFGYNFTNGSGNNFNGFMNGFLPPFMMNNSFYLIEQMKSNFCVCVRGGGGWGKIY